ncbi:MAG: aminopeptidase P family protein [Deltaproteobacteria bacterium]|nr:aminopeptidase P family protein [Deltaproteobacteria bacterium]
MAQDFRVPLAEIERRKERIQKSMQASGMDALFVVQRVDQFYFSGTAQSGFLYMPAEGDPLLLIKRYLPRARRESPLKNIVEIRSVRDIPSLIADAYGALPGTMGFEWDVMPVREFQFYRTLFQGTKCVDGSSHILDVRMIKSEWEVRQMENTAELSRLTFQYMKESIRPGITEMEFSGMIEAFARKSGHAGTIRVRDYQTEGYPWHILSGKSGGMVGLLDSPASGEGTSAASPCGAGSKPLATNEPIMVDFLTVLNGYHLDETRMFTMGSLPPKAFDACSAALEIHNELLEKTGPGVAIGDLFQHSVSCAERLGFAESYLGPPGYKVSFVGHGIGLELIEPPVVARGRKALLEPGMVLALEPKMVFDGEFIAGVESDILVTETGSRLLSRIPVEIFVCGNGP